MPRLLIFPIMFLIASCTPGPRAAEEAVASGSATVPPARVASDTVNAVAPDSESHNTVAMLPDSSLYIGEIRSFPETRELYTPAYYQDRLSTEGLYEALTEQADSLVFQDIERRRTRIPSTVARNHFNLSGLDTISVYKDARLIGKAKFVRVEHFNDVIESQFIVVFKPIGSKTFPDQLDYCVSSGKNPFEAIDITFQEIEDEALTTKLLKGFAQDSARVWHTLHTQVLPSGSVLSAISLESRLLLIETNARESHILKDLKEDWFIGDITPLHLQHNGKPILLLMMGKNETDWIWTSLAIYSGEEYVLQENNRLSGL